MTDVSICIPTYNGGAYIRETIESALSQTFADIEILIIDDGSIDDTVKIAEHYGNRDKRIRIFQNRQNLGLVENWNKCIQKADGKWIKFLFQDDLLQPNCIEDMLKAADPFRFVVCEREFIIEEDVADYIREFYVNDVMTLNQVVPGERKISPSTLSNAIWTYIGFNFIGEPTSVLIERSAFFEYGLFNRNLIQLCDLEYWARIGTNLGLCYVPEKLASFRVHAKSASADNHVSKEFHVQHLDHIILLHDYLYHPEFHAFRIQKKNINNIRKLLKSTIKRAKKHIRSVKHHSEKTTLTVAFENLISKYPILMAYL